jgi:hypothetical protein
LGLFAVWPISAALAHVAVLGWLYALSRWPIFGVPRAAPSASLTDFGSHVAALGKLLQATGDREFARGRLKNYRQLILGEAETCPAVGHDAAVEHEAASN